MEKNSFSLRSGSSRNPPSSAGNLSRIPSPPPPPLPPDPPNLGLLSLPSPLFLHSPSSTSPPRSRPKYPIAQNELVSTRPSLPKLTTGSIPQLQEPFASDSFSHFPPLPPSLSTKTPIRNPKRKLPKSVLVLPPLLPIPTPSPAVNALPGAPIAPVLNATQGPPSDPDTCPILHDHSEDSLPAPPPSAATSVPPSSHQTWAHIFRSSTDKTLKRLATPSVTPDGIPRVKIPETVFKKGAELHKDFIKGFFLGTPPPFNQIQSILNYMWGKGRKLEIHVNHIELSMLVRIPNDYIREKVLEKEYWHIGATMFYVAPWAAAAKPSPTMESIPIWAHVKGIHFDLMHQEGLSYIASLLGQPIEMDEKTLRLESTSEAKLKIKANLTKPLPSVVEAEREDGSIISLSVHYPWVPPYCSHCKKIGHLAKLCPHSVRVWKQVPTPETS